MSIIIVPVSGGKDSQACLKLAVQQHGAANVRGLFCDTQFEHPVTYFHVASTLPALFGVRIERVTGGSVLEKSEKYGRFPGGGARHCTDELKIRETKIFCKNLASLVGPFEVWYGMRTKESPERAARYRGKINEDLYEPHEVMPSKYPKYLGRMGVRFRLPILDWSEAQVIDFVGSENLNPLYRAGFPRVGCFPCLASGDKWKEKAFTYDDFGRAQYARISEVSQRIGKSVWTSKAGKAKHGEGPDCSICEHG